MPRGGDLNLYDGRRDFGDRRDAAKAFEDLCRDSSISAAQAKAWADKAAQKLERDAEKEAGASGKLRTSSAGSSNRLRVRFDWEPPEAGISLDDPLPNP